MANSNWDFGTLGDIGEFGMDALKNIGKSAVKGTMDMSDIVVWGGSTLLGKWLEAVWADDAGKVFKDMGSAYHDSVEEGKKTINEDILENTSKYGKEWVGKQALNLLSDYGDLLIPGAGTIKWGKLAAQWVGKFFKVWGLSLAKKWLAKLTAGKLGKETTIAFKEFIANTANHTPEKVAEFVKKFPQSKELFKDSVNVMDKTDDAVSAFVKSAEDEAVDIAKKNAEKLSGDVSGISMEIEDMKKAWQELVEHWQNMKNTLIAKIRESSLSVADKKKEISNIWKQIDELTSKAAPIEEKLASLREEYSMIKKQIGNNAVPKEYSDLLRSKSKFAQWAETKMYHDELNRLKKTLTPDQLKSVWLESKLLKIESQAGSLSKELKPLKDGLAELSEKSNIVWKTWEELWSTLSKNKDDLSKQVLSQNEKSVELAKKKELAEKTLWETTKNLEEATKEVEKLKWLSEQATKERLYEMVKNLWEEATEEAVNKVWAGPIRNAYNFLKTNKLFVTAVPAVGYGMKKAKGDENIFQSDDGMIPDSGVTDDNKETNKLVDAGKLPENQRENVPQWQVVDKVTNNPDGTATYRGYKITKNPDGTFSFPSKEAGRVGVKKTGFKTVKEATDYIQSQNLHTTGDVKEQTDLARNISEKEISNIKTKYAELKQKNPGVNFWKMVKDYMVGHKYDLSEDGKKQLARKFGIDNYTGTPEQDFIIIQQISQEDNTLTL